MKVMSILGETLLMKASVYACMKETTQKLELKMERNKHGTFTDSPRSEMISTEYPVRYVAKVSASQAS